MKHPHDEQLAEYVDGTLDLPDRAAVEAHLAFCTTCRADVEAARAARAALVALPNVEAPGVDLAFLPGLSPTEVAGVAPPPETKPAAPRVRPLPTGPRARDATTGPRGRREAKPRRRRPTLGQLLIGVAAVAVGLVLVVTFTGNHSTLDRASSGAPAASPNVPLTSAPEAGQDFTAQSFATFAKGLAREAKRGNALKNATRAPTISADATVPTNASATDRAVACVQQGTGLAAGTHLYFTEPGTLDGQKVYVVALIDTQGGNRSLLVVAVTVDGCQPLQVIHQAL